MNKPTLICAAVLLAAAAGRASPVDDVKAAIKKLADAPNYRWTTTVEMPNAPVTIGPADGKTENGGFTVITRSFNNNTTQIVRKGDQLVIQSPQTGDWMTAEELRQQFGGGGRGGFGGRGGAPVPADEVAALMVGASELKLADGVISGNLTDEVVARRIAFGRGGGPGSPPPPAKNATGTVKVWLKDGALEKYEVHVKGVVAGRDGQNVDRDFTTTTVIKDVGSTKVEVPAEAKQKLTAHPATG